MSWRGERWEDIVARAGSSSHTVRPISERESPQALAARAQPWFPPFSRASIATTEGGLVLGAGMESVEVSFAQLYHVEPVDPWPAVAVGWVDAGVSYKMTMTPEEQDAEAFATAVEEAVERCSLRVARATSRGWLEIPEQPWERTEALPGEVEEGPAMRGYRMAPGVIDPIVATRTIDVGGPRLWTWVIARLRRPPRRIEPRKIVLTKQYVYARTVDGSTLRIPVSTLREVRKNTSGDSIYVFARNTELFLVFEEECPLTAALDALRRA